MDNVNSIRHKLADAYQRGEGRENGTAEILNAAFVCDEDVIFGKPNKAYQVAEVAWYDSQSLDVNDLALHYGKVPVIWKEEAANTLGKINSNYGYLVYSEKNGSQYDNVYRELKTNPNSRRASMIYTNPYMHSQYNEHGKNDFCCTNVVTYYIRDKQLHSCVSMRSNDAVFGYINDLYWQKRVQIRLSNDLNVDVGSIMWHAQSLHVYERHYDHITNWIIS